MNPSHVEHIGIAVSNLKKSIDLYEKILGVKCYNIEEVVDQKVRTAFFLIGQTKIELFESTDPSGSIAKFIEKKGEGIHHIAFAVNDIEKQLNYMGNLGIQLIDSIPRRGAENMNIAFLHPKSTGGVLIELCENNNSK
jgi:methylmalonyl-CoA/ethylmalonyl-CoA epimerase